MKATSELIKEHQGIELMLRILKAIVKKIECDEEIPIDHFGGIIEFFKIFVDKCHHGKEEEFLFPALEAAGVVRDGGPIGVMLHEHEEGRKIIERLSRAVENFNKEGKTNTTEIRTAGNEYIELLKNHISKENSVLFPMAENLLDTNTDSALYASFDELEKNRIGVGKHEQFHAFLDQLSKTYLH